MAPNLLDAFGLEASDLRNCRGGKRVLAESYYPAFIWFPPGKPYEQAQQLCPEEFSSAYRRRHQAGALSRSNSRPMRRC